MTVHISQIGANVSEESADAILKSDNSQSIATLHSSIVGRDSSVGIATGYGLDGPGIESRWGRDIPHPSRPALVPTQPPIQWISGFFPGVKRPGRDVDHPPHLVPRLKKE